MWFPQSRHSIFRKPHPGTCVIVLADEMHPGFFQGLLDHLQGGPAPARKSAQFAG
jgi:hypothetical protein